MAEQKEDIEIGVSLFADIEQACHQFESELHASKDPELADFITGWEEPERSRLLSELIGIEIRHKSKNGVAAHLDSYCQRFPEDRVAIEEAFGVQQDEQTMLPAVLHEQLQIQSNLRHLRFLAEGGLGQVFLAEDASLRRDAAVKLIREDLSSDADSCEQFRVEAEVTGRLDHPGIPVVYAIGQTDRGRLFYAMQYVRGMRLDKLIRQHHKTFMHSSGSQWFGLKRFKLHSIRKLNQSDSGGGPADESQPTDSTTTSPLDLRALMEVFISVCHTVGYAHRRGILHRDIKPSNVIHGKFGETVVIDWGLALPVARQGVFKDAAEQTIAPRSGKGTRKSIGCVGTPAFMSPEQARGDVPLTPASDIFSLGSLLYCMLTGVPPYQGQSVMQVRQCAIDCDFPLPSSVIKDIPEPLESICLKAMKAQIGERYRTTHELVADLREYLADRPVAAHPDSNYRRLMRWMRHHTQTVLATILVMLVIASTIGLVGLWKSFALLKEQKQSQAQFDWATTEKDLRKKSLILAADLAAQTLANKIDVVYRTLELHSQEDELQSNLIQWNLAGDGVAEQAAAAQNVQAWLDRTVSAEPPSMQFRSWYVLTSDGTYVARTPEYADGNRSSSIGKRFAFRDYYHGLGQDLPPNSPASQPMECPHNSAAIFSTMDAQMTVNLAVPILSKGNERIGVLCVCVECRQFGDLEVDQAGDQQLLLVESRGYPMQEIDWKDDLNRFVVKSSPQWSAGVVLHHQSELYRAEFSQLPRMSEEVMQLMNRPNQTSAAMSATEACQEPARLFPEGVYQDPINQGIQEEWIAAYCPVLINTRADPRVADTGWFIIVQQKLVKAVYEAE